VYNSNGFVSSNSLQKRKGKTRYLSVFIIAPCPTLKQTFMYKQILQSLESVAPLAVFALIVFITFFVLMAIWIKKRNDSYIQHMSDLPLNDGVPAVSDSPEQS